jgi:carbon monoxide dehydrogenase subunit G
MTRWHQLERPELSTFTTAGQLYRYPAKFAAPPERVWQSLVSDESVAAWGVGVSSLTWTSPRPFGVGTTRSVVLPLRAMTLHEEFFRWDEGRGYSFYVVEANRPGVRSFAENYELEPDGKGTLFTWTIAIDPAPRLAGVMKAAAPLSRASFGMLVKAGRKYFAAEAGR